MLHTYIQILRTFSSFLSLSGGCGLSKDTILSTFRTASAHAQALHRKLNEAVQVLENELIEDKAIRLEMMRSTRHLGGTGAGNDAFISALQEDDSTVIGKDDPLLQWDSLHIARGAPDLDELS